MIPCLPALMGDPSIVSGKIAGRYRGRPASERGGLVGVNELSEAPLLLDPALGEAPMHDSDTFVFIPTNDVVRFTCEEMEG